MRVNGEALPALRQLQNDQFQSRNVGKILGVRCEQPEASLNRLSRKPEIIDANVWIPSGLSEFRGQAPECLGCFDGDPQLRFSSESTKHRRGALPLRTGWQQVQAELDFCDVDRRKIHWLLSGDGMNIGGRERATFDGDPQTGIDHPGHGSRSSATRPRRLFRCDPMAAHSRSAVSSSRVRYRSPNTFRAS